MGVATASGITGKGSNPQESTILYKSLYFYNFKQFQIKAQMV